MPLALEAQEVSSFPKVQQRPACVVELSYSEQTCPSDVDIFRIAVWGNMRIMDIEPLCLT